MYEHKPTLEQEAVIEAIANGKGSIDVDALAGAAKSTTLRMAAPFVRGKALALAFNVSIKKALETSLPPTFDVLTLNGLGHRAWAKFTGNRQMKVQSNKVYVLTRKWLEAEGYARGEAGYDELRDLVVGAVNTARHYGLVPDGAPHNPKRFYPDTPNGWMELAAIAGLDLTLDNLEETTRLARLVLLDSIQQSMQGQIDFNDQIYMSCCFSGTFPRYDVVFVDEAQDLSALNLYMVRKCAGAGRLVAVGDERQSIYAFRGADAEAIPNLRSVFKTTTLPLSTTFRCARALVANLHWRAPHMQAASWAPEGQVHTLKAWSIHDLEPGSAVVSRNNAPVIALAMKMIRQGVPVTVLGSEITEQLLGFIRRLAKQNPECPRSLLMTALDAWEAAEVADAERRDNPMKADRARDKAEVIRVLDGETAQDLMTNLSRIFENKHGIITLSTIHKAKGLEWQHVYHLNKHLLPSRYASSPRAMVQEDNMRYVADSRPKTDLTYINLDLVAES